MIVAHFLTSDEKLSSHRLIGVVTAMFGVVILIGADALQGFGLQVLAQVAMLGATLSYGFAAVYGKRFRATPPAVSAASMLSGATLLVLPIALVLERPWTLQPSMTSISAILGLSVLSTALAFIIWFKLINSAGATNTSMVTFLIPIVGLFLGVNFLGETLEFSSLLGLLFILLGLGIATKRFIK